MERNDIEAELAATGAQELLASTAMETIRIVHDVTQAKPDQYDRTLAYARHDGLDVGAERIAAGAAREYIHGSSFYERRSEYVRLQNYARSQDKGLRGQS